MTLDFLDFPSFYGRNGQISIRLPFSSDYSHSYRVTRSHVRIPRFVGSIFFPVRLPLPHDKANALSKYFTPAIFPIRPSSGFRLRLLDSSVVDWHKLLFSHCTHSRVTRRRRRQTVHTCPTPSEGGSCRARVGLHGQVFIHGRGDGVCFGLSSSSL